MNRPQALSTVRVAERQEMETVREWKFKLVDGISEGARRDLRLHIYYEALCSPYFQSR
ncbi:MAG: hypothetical protein WA875_12845 [Candidatus Acidiferrales bacterium]